MTLLDTILRRPPALPCREMVELMTTYIEGGLSVRDRRRFEHHVNGCQDCARYLAQVEATIAATGQLRPETLSAQAMDELRAAFRTWRDEELGEPAR